MNTNLVVELGYGEFVDKYDDCYLVLNHYVADNSLAIQIMSPTEGPIATITKCLCDTHLKDDESYIDLNNCPWLPGFINRYKLGENTGEVMLSGYCTYPKYKFNLDQINKYTV